MITIFSINNPYFEVININHEFVHFIHKDSHQSHYYPIESLKINEPFYLMDLIQTENRVLFKKQILTQKYLYCYIFLNKVYLLLESAEGYIEDNENIFETINFTTLSLVQTRMDEMVLNGINGEQICVINTILNPEDYHIEIDYSLSVGAQLHSNIVSIAKNGIYHIVVTCSTEEKKLFIDKIIFKTVKKHPKFLFTISSNRFIKISSLDANIEKEVDFVHIKPKKPIKIFNANLVHIYKDEHILGIYVINKTRYFLFLKRNGIFLSKRNPIEVTQHRSNLKVFTTRKSFFIFGYFAHHAYNAFKKYDHLYLRNATNPITTFIRPFAQIKYLKWYGYFKIPFRSLNTNSALNNILYVGDENITLHSLEMKSKGNKEAITHAYHKFRDYLHVLRTDIKGKVVSTIIPFSEEYSFFSKIKIVTAKYWAILFKKDKMINLYFEKKSNKADESAFRVFEKVIEYNPPSSLNYFILNRESEHYPSIKKKYGNKIIDKYSFRHYLLIYQSGCFISSELSNHVLNDRLYIDSLREKVRKTPLVFLQHGIMFAKPVDNPMAFGFHKGKCTYNVFKSVISSKLEANEFKKMKYSEEDLMLTGLATFDYAKLDINSDKIAYMPTYRYWEEGLIYANQIEETTYYKTLLKVIQVFKQEGLIDRLMIVPHNKFSDYIYRNMPEYKHIISDNPSEALKKARIFITDFSSAIYDAQYRGAYPIFYWEEKEYLIEKYKAIPPVNEENAPGPIAYDTHALMSLVKKAIKNRYEVEPEYKEKYKKINEFSDNNNTQRILESLIKYSLL